MLTMRRTGFFRWTKYECFILILITVCSGIYLDSVGVNSCFWEMQCKQSAAVLENTRRTCSEQGDCVREQMETCCGIVQVDADRMEDEENTEEALYFLDILPTIPFLYTESLTAYGLKNSSSAVIIDYLHRQDGEKTKSDCVV